MLALRLRLNAVYNDLPHPPDTYVGHQYAFRTADGSNNNPANPTLGTAGTPYARSVPQTHPLPVNELPDAGLVFDTLLRREKVRRNVLLSPKSSYDILLVCSSSCRFVEHDVRVCSIGHPHVRSSLQLNFRHSH